MTELVTPNFRDEPIRSKAVRDSVRGQPCGPQFPGICNGNWETTVFAHLNGAAFGKGWARKAHDILGMPCCAACHAYIDVGHRTHPRISDGVFFERMLVGACAMWLRIVQTGIAVIPRDPEPSFHDRPTPPRKPKPERHKPPAGRKLESRSDWPPKGSRKFPKRTLNGASNEHA